jgi:hypothetical protein
MVQPRRRDANVTVKQIQVTRYFYNVNRRLELTHFKAFKIDPPWGKKGV